MELSDLIVAIIQAYEMGYEKAISDAEIVDELDIEDFLDNTQFEFYQDGE